MQGLQIRMSDCGARERGRQRGNSVHKQMLLALVSLQANNPDFFVHLLTQVGGLAPHREEPGI